MNALPRPRAAERVMLGISGGVDSAVAAHLLRRQGVALQALFMKNWDEDDDQGHCPAEQDLADAEAVCRQLGVPLHARNFAGEYWDNVFSLFLDEYRAGRTPNPDVLCNREIKFKTFLEHALALGAEHMATGHYARVAYRDGLFRLLKARDQNKDQSYFLHALDQAQLSRALFPLGELSKPEVRRIAAEQGFGNAQKKDSTGICFIGERKFKDFLARFLPAQPGDMCTPEGQRVGRHDGLMFYTLGQRQGLGIGGSHGGSGEPWYVVGKDLAANTLLVAQGHDHPLLFRDTLTAAQVHWIAERPARLPFVCQAKTRYRQADQACTLTALDGDRVEVRFARPQRAVTPGQSVVFYQGDECLGGGIIQ